MGGNRCEESKKLQSRDHDKVLYNNTDVSVFLKNQWHAWPTLIIVLLLTLPVFRWRGGSKTPLLAFPLFCRRQRWGSPGEWQLGLGVLTDPRLFLLPFLIFMGTKCPATYHSLFVGLTQNHGAFKPSKLKS